MTKKEMFAEIRKVVADNAEMVAFIDHEIELLNRKSGSPRKPTKTQVENDGFKADILAALAEVDAQGRQGCSYLRQEGCLLRPWVRG